MKINRINNNQSRLKQFKKNTIVKSLIAVTILLSSLNTIGQTAEENNEKKSKFSFSGSVDAYFRTNLNAPNDKDAVAPATSFANLPGFALGMANLVVGYEGDKVGFIADLVYGPRAEDATFLSPFLRPGGTSSIVNQLYVYWSVNESVTLTLGNFNTFLGYEVISPAANFNYSTSYLFSYGPFSHAGLKADFKITDDLNIMLAVMNPTDATEYNPTGKYSFGAQLDYLNQHLNFLLDDGSLEIDFTGGFNISEDFFLGLDAAINDGGNEPKSGFMGAAIYPQYTISEKFALGVRAEYFKQIGNFEAIGTNVEDSSVFATTLTANIKIGDLTIIPELRLDASSDNFFLDKDLNGQKNLSSFVLAAVYKFD